MTASHTQILPRVLPAGVVVGLDGVASGAAAFASSWGGIRAAQVELNGGETPAGALVNHLVSLNLGPDTICEASIEGRPWQTYCTPHHGVGVMPARLLHAVRARGSGDVLLVELVPEFVAQVLGRRIDEPALPVVLGARDDFAEHVLLALADQARRGTGSKALAEGLATALVTHFASPTPPPPPAAPEPALPSLASPQLQRVLAYVAHHLDTPLSLERLAAVAGMDLYRFARAFKQSTGASPHHYLLQARIARAKELLRDRALAITEIALATGFATPSHFSVTFRRITGVTPRAFRDQHR